MQATDPGFASRGGRLGFFLILGKVSVLHGALPFSIVLFLMIKFMVLAQFLWLIYYEVEMPVRLYANQHNEEIQFNPTLGGGA